MPQLAARLTHTSMRGWLKRRHETPGDEALRRGDDEALRRGDDEPNPAVALAVGLIYVFRTAAGARIMRELEGAVRKYAADPRALWRLVRQGEAPEPPAEVIDTTVAEPKRLDAQKK
jgi:hypothetical protein